jgi:putative oxidoreductase
MLERVLALRNTALAALDRADFLPPLFGRFVVGFVFARSGYGKLGNLDGVIRYFDSLGIPFAEIQAPFVAGTELVCGLLLLAGLATRLAALPLIGTMVVALATALRAQIDGPGSLFGLSEFLYIVILVGLVFRGAGALSLDLFVTRALDARGGNAAARRAPDRGAGARVA